MYLGASSASEVLERLEALEDAQTGLCDLERAVEEMKDPPEDLIEAVERIRWALAGL